MNRLFILVMLAGLFLALTEFSEASKDYSGNDVKGIEDIVAKCIKPESKWREEAYERIRRHRMSPLELQIVDMQGLPISQAKISLTQLRHKFVFGGVISAFAFRGEKNNINKEVYKKLIPIFFAECGFGNAFKYRQTADRVDEIVPVVNWFIEKKIPLRGHTLIWPGGSHMPRELQKLVYGKLFRSSYPRGEKRPRPKKNYSDEEKRKIREFCDKMIIDYAQRWDVTEWDVINEPRGNHVVQDILGEEIAAHWFKLAKKHVKNANSRFLLNENRVISSPYHTADPDAKVNNLAIYENQVKFLQKQGAPISALGLQSRFRYDIKAEDIYARLERIAKLNLPIVATEMEVGYSKELKPDEKMRAILTERVMTLYFSHPRVDSIFAWTFFENENKKEIATDKKSETRGLLWADASLKLNGKLWLWLTKKLWRTNKSLTANAEGKANTRCFLGDYKMIVSKNGKTETWFFSLNDNKKQKLKLVLK